LDRAILLLFPFLRNFFPFEEIFPEVLLLARRKPLIKNLAETACFYRGDG
jgi:hypothetical protein